MATFARLYNEDGMLKGYAENKSMNTVILFNGEISGIAGFNSINWSNYIA